MSDVQYHAPKDYPEHPHGMQAPSAKLRGVRRSRSNVRVRVVLLTGVLPRRRARGRGAARRRARPRRSAHPRPRPAIRWRAGARSVRLCPRIARRRSSSAPRAGTRHVLYAKLAGRRGGDAPRASRAGARWSRRPPRRRASARHARGAGLPRERRAPRRLAGDTRGRRRADADPRRDRRATCSACGSTSTPASG